MNPPTPLYELADDLQKLPPREVAIEACECRRSRLLQQVEALFPRMPWKALIPSADRLARWTAFGRSVERLTAWLQRGEPHSWPLREAFAAFDSLRYTDGADACRTVELAAHARLNLALGLPVHLMELSVLGSSSFEVVASLTTHVERCYREECGDGHCDEEDCHCRLVAVPVAVEWLRSRGLRFELASPEEAKVELSLSGGVVTWPQRVGYCENDFHKDLAPMPRDLPSLNTWERAGL